MNQKVAVEVAQPKNGKPENRDGYPGRKPSKWAGRKREKKSHPSTAW
jgi:hypothetical protein